MSSDSKVREVTQDLFPRRASCEAREDVGHPNAHTPDARATAALVRLDRDALKKLHTMIVPAPAHKSMAGVQREIHGDLAPNRTGRSTDFFPSPRERDPATTGRGRNIVRGNHPSVSGFNVGINCGEAAGQTVSHCHVHLIPRRVGDVENPRGGVRAVIAAKQDYTGSS